MPQAKRRPAARKAPARKKKTQTSGEYTLNWVGAGFAVVGALALVRLGLLGTTLANVLRIVGGDAYFIPALCMVLFGAFMLFSGRTPQLSRRYVGGGFLTYCGLLLWLTARTMNNINVHAHFMAATWQILKNDFAELTTGTACGGGMIGALLYMPTYPLITQVGVFLVALILMAAGIMIICGVTPNDVFATLHTVGVAVKEAWERLSARLGDWHDRQLDQREQTAGPDKTAPGVTKKARRQTAATTDSAPVKPAAPDAKDLPRAHNDGERLVGQVDDPTDDFYINVPDDEPADAEPVQYVDMHPEAKQETTVAAVELSTGEPTDDYQLPPLDLLSLPPKVDQSDEVAAIERNRTTLERTFASFGVDVTVKEASLGPSITKYAIQPATGVKVSKIVNLADDLALALAAKDIRIEAPIPGRSLIGIEVPNNNIATVGYREVLAKSPQHPGKSLVIPLGKDVAGTVVTADLAKMPHLLIAGATGSGKSVMINVIITSILMTAKPTEVRLMLIDPKKVELSIYDGVPHLLAPVVTEAKRAPSALNKILQEMERRYERFAAAGVRNMGEYNQKVGANPEEGLSRMPYIVVIVDELADLMMVAGAEVETAIIRIGQMARAAGIHMIIATQRPSVDVITGLIKANIPSRIAFAVSSGVDSRTILDMNGAERLLGRGDMLYDPIDMNKPQRVQGAFIPSEDVESIVKFITEQVAPAYDESMIPSENDEPDAQGDSDDDLFDEALQFVTEKQGASTSMLQRRFRIGYNRAARLIDDLENRGYIGPSEGSKPRKVYAKPKPEDPTA